MRTRWIAGVAAGVALGLATVLSIEAATDDASAQAGFTVSAEQLRINQRISQASVKRSNRSLNYLAPIRTTQSDNADDGSNGVRPLSQITGSGQGWTTAQIASNAITTVKVADAAITTVKVADAAITEAKLAAALANKLPKWGVVNADGSLARGSTGVTSLRVNAGNYRVAFGQDVSQCSWTGVQLEVTAANLGNIGIELDVTDPTRLFVRTTDAAAPGATADRAFSVQVAC
ncbi:MAG: hypothetical protein AB7V62_08815 [Thermoleophilia bacterium]